MLENFVKLFNERLCRLCLGESEFMEELFESEEMYTTVIEDLIGLKVMQKQAFPHLICNACTESLQDLATFKSVCLKTEEVLQSFDEIKKKPAKPNDIALENIETHPATNVDQKRSNYEDMCASQQKPNSTIETNENLRPTASKIVSRKKTSREKKQNLVKCKICGKSYIPSRFVFHMNTHNNVKPYVCPYEDCKKSFPSPFQLKSHNKVVHTDTFPYQCDICGHPFKVKTSLIIHRSYHTDPELPCSVCGKLLRNTRAMKRHMMIHTGERPFPCDKCNKSFQTRYTLKIHQRSHTREKPFVCSRCGKCFGHNCVLKGHMLKCHPENIDELW